LIGGVTSVGRNQKRTVQQKRKESCP